MKLNKERRETINLIASVVTALGVGVAVWQLLEERHRSREQTALESFRDWMHNQPNNAEHCIKMVALLPSPAFENVMKRVAITVPPELDATLRACFADLDGTTDLSAMYKDGQLTRKGVFELAHRASGAVDTDQIIAIAFDTGIGDYDAIERQMKDIVSPCEERAITNLRRFPEHAYAYDEVLKMYDKLGHPQGDCTPD